jgi:hypothetical protein
MISIDKKKTSLTTIVQTDGTPIISILLRVTIFLSFTPGQNASRLPVTSALKSSLFPAGPILRAYNQLP